MTTNANQDIKVIDSLLREDRMPHIWCSGCGIGPIVGCFIRSIKRAGLDPDKTSIISGIGCSGRAA